jgi:hypothetical protein
VGDLFPHHTKRFQSAIFDTQELAPGFFIFFRKHKQNRKRNITIEENEYQKIVPNTTVFNVGYHDVNRVRGEHKRHIQVQIFHEWGSACLHKMPVFVQPHHNHCHDNFFILFDVSIKEAAAVSIVFYINSGSRKINLSCLHRPTGEGAWGNQQQRPKGRRRKMRRVPAQMNSPLPGNRQAGFIPLKLAVEHPKPQPGNVTPESPNPARTWLRKSASAPSQALSDGCQTSVHSLPSRCSHHTSPGTMV